MTRKRVVLPTPLEPMSPVNSPWRDLERDVIEDRSDPRMTTPTSVDLEDGRQRRVTGAPSKFGATTAALMAATSASIQDW